MAEEFSRHKVEHEVITMKDRGHGFDREMDDQMVKNAFTKVLAFLDKHTKQETYNKTDAGDVRCRGFESPSLRQFCKILYIICLYILYLSYSTKVTMVVTIEPPKSEDNAD